MRLRGLCAIFVLVVAFVRPVHAQQKNSCTSLMDIRIPNVEIIKAAHVEAGTSETIPWNQSRIGPLPAYCRVEGMMNRRTGVDGEEFGITFVLAFPEKWNATS